MLDDEEAVRDAIRERYATISYSISSLLTFRRRFSRPHLSAAWIMTAIRNEEMRNAEYNTQRGARDRIFHHITAAIDLWRCSKASNKAGSRRNSRSGHPPPMSQYWRDVSEWGAVLRLAVIFILP